MNKNIPGFTIAIDNREKHAYSFANSISTHLETGDYAILEAPLAITIDRKNPQDAVSTIIQHRDRFIAEMERMQEYEYRAIVIESSLEDLLKPYQYSKAKPKAVIQSYTAFSIRYNIHVVYACNRTLAKTMTLRMLEWKWIERCRKLGLI